MSVTLPDLKESALWLDDVSAWAAGDVVRLPASVDVMIIGAGYTGLNAALECARGGLSTLLIDSGVPGAGCSTKNGGQISTSVKPSLDALSAKFGGDRARAIRAEGANALQWIESRIRDEKIDCDFQRCGRFHAAHTPAHFQELLRDVDALCEEGIDVHAVSSAEQREELGTDAYHGGLVFTQHASLHPARYHRGLLERACEAGACVVSECAALKIERKTTGFDVTTERGMTRAENVIVATNGYTGSVTPWLQRRAIPIGSYIIATEPLPPEQMDRLFPKNRIVSDTCKVVYYYRASTDRKRIVFGGRVSSGEIDHKLSAQRLQQQMCRLFPELRDVAITHSWSGKVAYSFDERAHTGVHEGVHYAMCYCGSGVSMASYLGMRLGQKVLGLELGVTAFDDLPFPTRPLYKGRPWFLPPVVAWYRLRDRWETRQYA
ncbi:MAG: NAD(P)/FAD-dependent oxidoreductase [Granulosicoccus sp.]